MGRLELSPPRRQLGFTCPWPLTPGTGPVTNRVLPQQKLPLPITPRGGAIGTEVGLEATGLPPQTNLLIAFANLQSYQLLQRVTTDDEGHFTTRQEVPPWAIVGGVHYFFASFSDERPLALSEGFHVTMADGTARVRGKIGGQAEHCIELRDSGDVLYHLVGGIGERVLGDRVTVTGTIADAAACAGPGISIAVTDITS